MNTFDQETITAQLNQELDPELLERDLKYVVFRYQRYRTPSLARHVLKLIETIGNHPNFHGSDEQRCAYRRLARSWRYLAQAPAAPLEA